METPSPRNSLFILDHIPGGVITLDEAGQISWCNQTLVDWLGGEDKDYLGLSEAALLYAGNPADAIIGNGRYQLNSGRWLLRKQHSLPDGGLAVTYLDITEPETLRRDLTVLTQQLEHFDTIEPVSGLLNDQAINKGLDPLVSRSRRYKNALSLVTMQITSLDDTIRDAGQAVADKIILGVSQLLRDQIRWADLLGRLDNGHFVFVLPETDQDAAMALAQKIAGQLNQLQVRINEQQSIQPKACFGIASWAQGDDASSMLKRSAEAAQAARQHGAFAIEAA